MHMFHCLQQPIFWVALFIGSVTAQLPYNPTQILQNGSFLYIFEPSSESQFQLASIDLSTKAAASKIPRTILYSALPFLDPKTPRPFSPVINNQGGINVFTGDCAKGATGAELWTFSPTSLMRDGNGTWKHEGISSATDAKSSITLGPNYLNAGVSFSSLVNGGSLDNEVYIFGGMCPTQNGSNEWQSAANYSNMMVTIEPSQSASYKLGVSSSRGPPIAEAGFTMTGLAPSFSNKSDGTQTQQQNFVLVGGHTSTAFINMSQVALFSLPQQGWTFVPVQQPNTERTDLAIRTDVTEVESRSGHTAVLTPDGQRIVIFGGWIGDVNTPADPQLAVLSVGEGYGGKNTWEWTVPVTSGSGLVSGTGLYGHGAVMLPGGVMMIAGGYSVSAHSRHRRRSTPAANTRTLFFNTTSNMWLSEYSPPAQPSASEENQSGPLAKTSQKAGLGVGLTLGFAAVFGLLVFYIWYTRRLKKHRETREKQIQDMATNAHRYNVECLSPGIDGRGGHIDAVDYFDDPHDAYYFSSNPNQANQGWRRTSGQNAERTGLLVEIPSPTRGLRRSLGNRGNYYPVNRVKGTNNIHPIDELEEEEQEHANDQTPLSSRPEMSEKSHRGSIFDNAPNLDPFTDNNHISGLSIGQRQSVIHSAPASPTREMEGELLQLPHDFNLAIASGSSKAAHKSSGRDSPTKSERTRSDLSERSTRSNLSSTSANSGVRRSTSIRSGLILNANTNPFKTPNGSPTSDTASHRYPGHVSPELRTRSMTSTRSTRSTRPNTANADADSFTTARSSFMALQAEGEALLGGIPDHEKHRPGTSSTTSNSNSFPIGVESSFAATNVVSSATSADALKTRPRRRSWLGSVRKVLSRTTSTSADTRDHSSPKYDPYNDTLMSPTTPTTTAVTNRRSLPASAPPRRAASDASFWRSKRGQQDWLDDELDPDHPKARWRRNSGDDWGAPEDALLKGKEEQRRSAFGSYTDADPEQEEEEEDWDVEAAVERRVVQVMFTVPKTRLRVVNADIDGNSLISLDETNDRRVGRGRGEESKTANEELNEIMEKDGEKEDSPSGVPRTSGRYNSPSRVKNLVGMFEAESSKNSSNHSLATDGSPKFKGKGKEGALDMEGSISPKYKTNDMSNP